MSDDRPQYDGYKRPSPFTCVVGVLLAGFILLLVYVFALFILPDIVSSLTYPLLALFLVIVVGGAIYYFATNRQRREDQAQEAAQRQVSDKWVQEQLAATPFLDHADNASGAAAPKEDDQ